MYHAQTAGQSQAPKFIIGQYYKHHRAGEFLKFLKEMDAHVPEGFDVHIVMDQSDRALVR
jgi:hypothetical protein